jgi:hypothetical protein
MLAADRKNQNRKLRCNFSVLQVADDAVGIETVSPGPSPCNLPICREIFRNAGRAIYRLVEFHNDCNTLQRILLIQGAGRIFGS